MKYQKSSHSLHYQPSSILKQQSPNTTTTTNFRLQWKTHSSSRKEFTSVYNARGRLNSMREEIQFLQQQSKVMELGSKDLRLQLRFIKEQYCDRRLVELNTNLNNLIKDLKKKVVIGNRSDLLKYESIQNIYEGMCKNQKELKHKVNQIEERVQILENIMGTDSSALRNNMNY